MLLKSNASECATVGIPETNICTGKRPLPGCCKTVAHQWIQRTGSKKGMLNRICLGLYSPEIYTGSHVRSLVLSGSSSDICERQQDSSRPTSYPISREANKQTNKRLNSNKGSKMPHAKLNTLCLRNDQQQRFWLSICYRYRRRRRPIGWLFVCFTVFFFRSTPKGKKNKGIGKQRNFHLS